MLVKKCILNTKVYSAANYAEKCVTSTLKDMTELKDVVEFFTCTIISGGYDVYYLSVRNQMTQK
jgi:hypothetical protein